MSKVLLIIDLQKQFEDTAGNYRRIVNKIEDLIPNYDKVYATVFSQGKKSNFKKKLGWNGCQNCTGNDLDFSIRLNDEIIIKDTYGIKDLPMYLRDADEVTVVGCEADSSILAVCFQLWDLGYNFKVLSDYIFSNHSLYSTDTIKLILNKNFGDCVV